LKFIYKNYNKNRLKVNIIKNISVKIFLSHKNPHALRVSKDFINTETFIVGIFKKSTGFDVKYNVKYVTSEF
jgi:hypothetical protein